MKNRTTKKELHANEKIVKRTRKRGHWPKVGFPKKQEKVKIDEKKFT